LKPARYLGGEYHAVKKDWAEVDVRICMAFPEVYDIGMSHLGTKIIYDLLNRHPRIACERAFTPWSDMEAALLARGLPVLSLESARPLRDFDVVGMSLQYELTYTNALNLLTLSGIPRRSADRGEADPIIMGGGPTATHCEPMAPFIDAFLVGDAERALPEALVALARWKAEGLGRAERLLRLANEHEGWYVPALYDVVEDPRTGFLVVDAASARGPWPVKRTLVQDLDRYPFPSASPVAAAEAIFDRMSIEIARGCTEGCRFCQAGMIYRPVRERDPDQIIETVLAALDGSGYDEVSLTSLSTADYSCVSPLIKRVMEKLRERRVSLSVSSLRAYGLDEDLLDEISTVKATGLTFAPEAGTQRMRDVVNKNISEEDIQKTAHRVFSRGWAKMKLYFMIGLPTETDEDVAGIIETAARARQTGWQYHPRGKVQVTASTSSHVPKPHTPFQWAPMDGVDEIQRKQALLRDLGRRHKINVKYHNWRESFVEGILSRGDRRVADVIERAFDNGARLDAWDEHLRLDAWLSALTELEVDPQRYLGTIPVDARLPWDHIDVGLEPGFLAQEWKRATKNRLSPPCGKPVKTQVHHTNLADHEADQRKLVCYHCGIACDLDKMRADRGAYLTRLGALTRDDVKADGFVPAYKTVRKDKDGRNLPPERQGQGQSHRYRLVFTKLGTVAVTSHLDLARALPRIIRRAGLSMTYSRGFTPRALVSYGPALSLGVRSLGEACDVFLNEAIAPDELMARVEAVTDPGLHLLACVEVAPGAPTITKLARVAEYLVHAPGASGDAFAAAVARARGAEPVRAEVIRKHGPKTIDVRDGLVAIAVDVPSEDEARWLDLPRGTPVLRWRVDLVRGAHVRPGELGKAIVPGAGEIVAARTALFAHVEGEAVALTDPRLLVGPSEPDRGAGIEVGEDTGVEMGDAETPEAELC